MSATTTEKQTMNKAIRKSKKSKSLDKVEKVITEINNLKQTNEYTNSHTIEHEKRHNEYYGGAAAGAENAAAPQPAFLAMEELEMMDWIEEPFQIIESYFEGHHLERLVRHQIESFNNFCNFQLYRTIRMFNPIVARSETDFVSKTGKYFLEVMINLENLKLYPPQIYENNGATKLMFPQEARLRNFTYASAMTVDIHIKYIIRNDADGQITKTVDKILPKINIGKLPIMLKSSICLLTQNKHLSHTQTGECKYDCGGYFIINGSEKTVLAQERPAENRIYCFYGKNVTKWSWYAEIKSVPDYKCISPKQIDIMIANKNNGFGNAIYVNIPRIKTPIELFIVFRALGIESDRAICEFILLDIEDEKLTQMRECLRASIMEANNVMTQADAMKYITSHVSFIPLNMDRETGQQRKREYANEILQNDLFPHCRTMTQKIYFLGYMTNTLLQASLGWIPLDDRDSYVNKRIELTGSLLNNLFRNYLNKLVKEIQKQTVREINTSSWCNTEDYENIINMINIYKILKPTTIENGIKRALSTGDFSIKQSSSSSSKVGVAQVLNRLTYAASLSHLRRINTPLDKNGELVIPRKLHNTTWGFLCPPETPEGQSIGVVKNLSYMAHITIPVNSQPLYEYVMPFIDALDSNIMNWTETASAAAQPPQQATVPKQFHKKVKVFINGVWLGVAHNPIELYENLKQKKCQGIINIYTSIVFYFKSMEIRICNDGGRLTRPVLRVQQNKLLINTKIIKSLEKKTILWNDLCGVSEHLDKAVIEYIDPDEQNGSMIAMKPIDLYNNKATEINSPLRYTHCEIHPSTIFGIMASCSPFPECNQSPRNTYSVAMGKQSMGIYATNFYERMDKSAYIMTYPSRSLVDTRLMGFIKLNEIPSGSQCIVAIMTHTGYNQEDSILINRSSIDRGMFNNTVFHTEKDENKKINGDEQIRCRPDPTKTKGMKFGNYDKINSQGFVPENVLIEDRDIIISKILPIKENRNDPTKVIKFEDHSKSYKTTEETYIDKNYMGRNGDGYNFAKVRTRTYRKPVIGDKFASNSAQKGTVGNIIPEQDMPFTSNGIRPDIIINPHCLPSRMTVAQLKETLLCKVLVELGLFGDGTAFGDLSVRDHICRFLQSVGFESNGNEIMYNGLTGEQMNSSIFIGPCYYKRLKHMVNDKAHSRSTGPMVILTRQPTEGRSKGGGLRMGEMERDVLTSGGYSAFLRERFYDAADKFSTHICKSCGLIAAYNDKYNIHICRMCDNRTEFAYVELPYSFKLMTQELQTINVVPRLITE